VVKFTDRYNSVAHRLLTEHNLAPKLLYDSHKDPTARVMGCYMIVMEYLEGKTAQDFFSVASAGHLKTSRNQALGKIICEDVKMALQLLHNAGLVFGDLRSPNIMIVKDRANLIDYEWCGKDGEARYPVELNDAADNIKWHPDVVRNGVLSKDHDLWMLDLLFPHPKHHIL
jgi:serine/threonine protein kinase